MRVCGLNIHNFDKCSKFIRLYLKNFFSEGIHSWYALIYMLSQLVNEIISCCDVFEEILYIITLFWSRSHPKTDNRVCEAIKSEPLGLEMYQKVFQGAKIYTFQYNKLV